MHWTEGLLAAIVIVLMMVIITNCCKRDASRPCEISWDPSPQARACPQSYSVEKAALRDNAEYFATGSSDISGADDYRATSCNSFGTASGDDYRDWVTRQAVDPQVIKNHSEFVADRLSNNPQNATGRTFAMGKLEGTDQVPWIGIRGRSQNVPVDNPTQVPDVDPRSFTDKPRFNWNSM